MRKSNLVLQELGRSSELGTPDLNSNDANLNSTEAGAKKRFLRISDRDFSSRIFDFNNVDEYIEIMRNSKWNKFKWKDLTLMKDPMTLTIYLDRVPRSGVRALRSTRLPAGRAGTFRLPRWAA